MTNEQPNLFTRSDTFFGVCQGLGDDLGIHPHLLRLPLVGVLFYNPLAALGVYACAGALVLVTRLLYPEPRPALTQQPDAEAPPAAQAAAEDAPAEQELEALAA